MVSSLRLYNELGLDPAANPTDVRRAYHRAALQCHPDKAGPAGLEKFKRVKEAYEVLSDPTKRSLYDRYGENGLSYMNDPTAQTLAQSFGASTLVFVGSLGALLLFITILLVLSFTAARVDGKTDWKWATIFSPLWVWDSGVAVVLLIGAIVLIKNWLEDRAERQDVPVLHRLVPFYMIAIVLLMISHHIAVVSGLDAADPRSQPWWKLFAPGIISEGMICLMLLRHSHPDHLRSGFHAQGLPVPSDATCYCFVANRLAAGSYRLLMFILIAAKLSNASGMSDASWHVVGVPMYIYLTLSVVSTAALTKVQMELPNSNVTFGQAVCVVGSSMIMYGLIAVSTGLLCGKAAGAEYPLAHALIPFLLLLSFFTLSSFFGTCAAGVQMAQQLEQMELQQTEAEMDGGDHQRFSDGAPHAPQYVDPGFPLSQGGTHGAPGPMTFSDGQRVGDGVASGID